MDCVSAVEIMKKLEEDKKSDIDNKDIKWIRQAALAWSYDQDYFGNPAGLLKGNLIHHPFDYADKVYQTINVETTRGEKGLNASERKNNQTKLEGPEELKREKSTRKIDFVFVKENTEVDVAEAGVSVKRGFDRVALRVQKWWKTFYNVQTPLVNFTNLFSIGEFVIYQYNMRFLYMDVTSTYICRIPKSETF